MPRTPEQKRTEDAQLYFLQRCGHIGRSAEGEPARPATELFSYQMDLLLAGKAPTIHLNAATDLIRAAWEAGMEQGADLAMREGLARPDDLGPGRMAETILALSRDRGGDVHEQDLIGAGWTREQIAAYGEEARARAAAAFQATSC